MRNASSTAFYHVRFVLSVDHTLSTEQDYLDTLSFIVTVINKQGDEKETNEETEDTLNATNQIERRDSQ